jgi:hypothetical protein
MFPINRAINARVFIWNVIARCLPFFCVAVQLAWACNLKGSEPITIVNTGGVANASAPGPTYGQNFITTYDYITSTGPLNSTVSAASQFAAFPGNAAAESNFLQSQDGATLHFWGSTTNTGVGASGGAAGVANFTVDTTATLFLSGLLSTSTGDQNTSASYTLSVAGGNDVSYLAIGPQAQRQISLSVPSSPSITYNLNVEAQSSFISTQPPAGTATRAAYEFYVSTHPIQIGSQDTPITVPSISGGGGGTGAAPVPSSGSTFGQTGHIDAPFWWYDIDAVPNSPYAPIHFGTLIRRSGPAPSGFQFFELPGTASGVDLNVGGVDLGQVNGGQTIDFSSYSSQLGSLLVNGGVNSFTLEGYDPSVPGNAVRLQLDAAASSDGTSVVMQPGTAVNGQQLKLGDTAASKDNVTIDNSAGYATAYSYSGAVIVGNAGQGTLNLSAGSVYAASGLSVGARPGASGALNVSSDLSFNGKFVVGGAINPDGSTTDGGSTAYGNVNVLTGGVVYGYPGSTLTIYSGGNVNLTGGAIYCDHIDNSHGGILTFTSGSLYLTNSDFNVGGDATATAPAGGLLGSYVDLQPGQILGVSGNTTVAAGGILIIDGGSFTTSSLTNSGTFQFNGGTFGLQSDLGVDSAAPGVLGDNVSLPTGSTLNIGGTLVIGDAATGYLRIPNGSSLTAGQLNIAAQTSSSGALVVSGSLSVSNSLAVGGHFDTNGNFTQGGAGALSINAGASATASSVCVGSGSGLRVDGTLAVGAAGAVVISSGGTLSGNGTIGGGPTILQSRAMLSPGGGVEPAHLTTDSQQWNSGAIYDWEIANAQGVAGIDWDSLTSSQLNLASTAAAPCVIHLTSMGGNVPGTAVEGFDPAKSYSWTIGEVSSLDVGADATPVPAGPLVGSSSAGLFILDTSDFATANGVDSSTGIFELSLVDSASGEQLVLSYDATPEPGIATLIAAGLTPLLMARRRWRYAAGSFGSYHCSKTQG